MISKRINRNISCVPHWKCSFFFQYECFFAIYIVCPVIFYHHFKVSYLLFTHPDSKSFISIFQILGDWAWTWPHILKKNLSSTTTTYQHCLINVVCERPLVQKWYKNTFFFKFQVTGPIIVKRMNTSNGTVYYQQPAAASNSSAVSANCRDPSRNPASSDSISSKNFKVFNGGIQNEIP